MSFPTSSIDLILFAIQGGIRLVQTGRKVYVETTIEGEVELPLPSGFQQTPVDIATDYAITLIDGTPQEKKRFTDDYKEALDNSDNQDKTKKQQAKSRLVQQYIVDIAAGLVPNIQPKEAGWHAIAVIGQWSKGESPFPSSFQRIAGSLVEISIDYFVHVPGALNENSTQGKALKSFLQGLSAVNFEDARLDSIAISLFTTALDVLKDNPDLITNETDDQSLIKQIVSGVATDISDRLKQDEVGNPDTEEHLKHFGQIVLRSLLKNGATAVLDSPSILTQNKEGQVLVNSVGSAFLGLLVNEDNGSLTEALRKVASTEGFDTLVRAGLKAVVEHPDYFGTKNQTVDKWLNTVLSELYNRPTTEESFFDPELFVEIAHSILDNGLRDLPSLLGINDTKPAFLVDVVRKVFDVIIAPAGGNPPLFKSLQLSRSDLKDLCSGVLHSLTTNSSWLKSRPDLQQGALTLVPLIVNVLGNLKGDSLKTLIRSEQLSTVISAVLTSEIPNSLNEENKANIVKGINTVLDSIRKNGATGSRNLLSEDNLCDLLTALVRSDLSAKLFDGDDKGIVEVIEKLEPIFEALRQSQTLTLGKMVNKLNN